MHQKKNTDDRCALWWLSFAVFPATFRLTWSALLLYRVHGSGWNTGRLLLIETVSAHAQPLLNSMDMSHRLSNLYTLDTSARFQTPSPCPYPVLSGQSFLAALLVSLAPTAAVAHTLMYLCIFDCDVPRFMFLFFVLNFKGCNGALWQDTTGHRGFFVLIAADHGWRRRQKGLICWWW